MRQILVCFISSFGFQYKKHDCLLALRLTYVCFLSSRAVQVFHAMANCLQSAILLIAFSTQCMSRLSNGAKAIELDA